MSCAGASESSFFNQGCVSGKNENCNQTSPWLFLPEHTITPGEKSLKGKETAGGMV